jgi:hypothetical protein
MEHLQRYEMDVQSLISDKQATTWAVQNPTVAAGTVVGATGLGVVALPTLVTTPLLWGAGYLGSISGGMDA